MEVPPVQNIHISHYDISIDSLNFAQHVIRAVTGLAMVSNEDGLADVQLLLDGLTVDSVTDINGDNLSFTHDGLNLNISLPILLNAGDSLNMAISYHGSPAQDPSGWGGFYWSGTNYAFNMGVGFDEDPHVFGRAWFPCVDAFTDRATYDFHITVDSGHKAFCNGELQSVQYLGNGQSTYNWKLSETIPTYLASMAVADYHFLQRTYSGIPTTWAAWAIDTVNVLSTFQHIQQAVDIFTQAYGPYRWEKIGFALVPFNSGAMEHATSIHIGRPFIDGTLSYETLWAHEFSHMWWGDLVTCKDEQNMWLNEGFAVYSEELFTQGVYGEQAYKEKVRQNHRQVLQFSHVKDGGYFALDQIPHNVTYGSTVYEKGPDVVHTLRDLMGDSLFFLSCRNYMDSLAFGNADSHDLRDRFMQSSGLDLTGFFDGWVFQPGFPHFQVDSFNVVPAGDEFQVNLHIRQKQRGNDHTYQMPIEVNLADADSSRDIRLDISQLVESFEATVGFEPTMVTIDRQEKMSDAIADLEMNISSIGNYPFSNTNASVEVLNAGTQPNIVRIEDHFVSPDGFLGTNPGIVLNPYHYWTIDGLLNPEFRASVEFKYDGGTGSTSHGHMDDELIVTEDSLLMLYRSNPGREWEVVDGLEVITGSSLTNKRGSIRVDTLKRGEYVLGRYDYTASANGFIHRLPDKFAYPNPNKGTMTFALPPRSWAVTLFGLSGERVGTWTVTDKMTVDMSPIIKGTYILQAVQGADSLTQKVIIQ